MKSPLTFNHYQQALADQQWVGLYCEACGACTVPPQAVCRLCGGRQLHPKPVEKIGTLRTFTVIRVAAAGWSPPFIVALVETDAGPWVMGNLEGIDPDKAGMELIGQKVHIDSRVVKGDVYAGGDMRSLVFHPLISTAT